MENEPITKAEIANGSRCQAIKSALAGKNPHRAIVYDKHGAVLFDVSLAMGLTAVGLMALWSPTLLIIAGIFAFFTNTTLSIDPA